MPLKRTVYETKEQERADLWRGVGLWFALNVAMYVVRWIPPYLPYDNASVGDQISVLMTYLPWTVNLGALAYFGFTRRWVALGMLVAFAAALAFAIVAGILFLTWCFLSGATWNNQPR